MICILKKPSWGDRIIDYRVHPTRENNLIREVRPAVADAVVRALR